MSFLHIHVPGGDLTVIVKLIATIIFLFANIELRPATGIDLAT